MGKKDVNKPRGRMSAYAFFVQTCREEHKRKHPDESVIFAEFSKKCAEKWKSMTSKEKKRFDEMAEKDKTRYQLEMEDYEPPPKEEQTATSGKKRKKKTKDPNAPKRALSGFFLFCGEQRQVVRDKYPDYTVGEVAKELGKRWEVCDERERFDELAKKEKARYEAEMEVYRKKNAAGSASPPKKAKIAKPKEEPELEDDEDGVEEEPEEEEEVESDD